MIFLLGKNTEKELVFHDFSILNLPSVVNLIHIDPSPAPLPATNRLREERKDRHFTLKIADIDQQEDHQLKYPGRKKIASIKDDVYSLTLIPPNRQKWRGWPRSSSDSVSTVVFLERRIFCRIFGVEKLVEIKEDYKK